MWPGPQETADLVTFNEEIIYEKLHFLCSECSSTLIKTDQLIFYKVNRQKKKKLNPIIVGQWNHILQSYDKKLDVSVVSFKKFS